MFFKVASGLCLYFIASSLWGIAERKLLPKACHRPAAVRHGASPRSPRPPPATARRQRRRGSAAAARRLQARLSCRHRRSYPARGDAARCSSELPCTTLTTRSPPSPRRRRGAARAIVRLSGPRTARSSLKPAFGRPRRNRWLTVHSAATVVGGLVVASAAGRCSQLPVDLYLWPDRRSYTRQPAAEIHTIGSPPLLSALRQDASAAAARPGRAGRVHVAGVSGRPHRSDAGRGGAGRDRRPRRRRSFATALEQLAGGLARPLAALRGRLLDLLAHLEAGLDFVEEDIEFVTPEQVRNAASSSRRRGRPTCTAQLDGSRPRRRAGRGSRSSVGRTSARAACSTRWPAAAALVSDEPARRATI